MTYAEGPVIAVAPAAGPLARRLAAIGCRIEPASVAALTVADGRVVPPAAQPGGLLVVVDRADLSTLDAWRAAGATHFVALPAGDDELGQAVAFAAAAAERRQRRDRRAELPAEGEDAALGWIGTRLDRGRPLAVVRLSPSRLDLVNAAHGRPAGDALLEDMGYVVTKAARAAHGEHVFVARLSGADFLLAAETSAEAIAATAARIGDALAVPLALAGRTAVHGTRFGVAAAITGDDGAALLRRAEDALAAARGSDGAIVRIAAERGAPPLDALAVDLHHAMDRGEIEILFQPQAELATGRIVGVEALARWEHATLGPLGADALFAAAGRADLGLALSDHIQSLVLAAAAGWAPPLDRLRVALNVTAGDVARAGFAEQLLARVDASGFPRDRLTIEVTESGAIDDLEAAAALLAALRTGGCRIAIDDFGTGYSSLAYLAALPLDYWKLDKALARRIDGSERDRVVVRGVIDMARALGVTIIAEGIETEVQRAALEAAGCGLYQGFLLAPPLDEVGLAAAMEGR